MYYAQIVRARVQDLLLPIGFPSAPIAAFGSTSPVQVGSVMTFTSTSTTTNGDGKVASWTWDFGDGQSGTGNPAYHAYARAGTFNVTLNIADSSGYTNVVTHAVSVTAAPVNTTWTVSTLPITSFSYSGNLAFDTSGNLFVADNGNYQVIKIAAGNVLTNFASRVTNDPGGNNGQLTVATVWPIGVVTDSSGNVYVSDAVNSIIRKFTPSGFQTIFAGSGSKGSSDGQGVLASFNTPTSITVDGSGNILVADSGNHAIRKITPSGVVSTFTTGLGSPIGIAADSFGNVYVSDGNGIQKVNSSGVASLFAGGSRGFADGQGASAMFYQPAGLACDANGNLFVADAYNNKIRKITSSGLVSTVAGGSSASLADGVGTDALFNGSVALTFKKRNRLCSAPF